MNQFRQIIIKYKALNNHIKVKFYCTTLTIKEKYNNIIKVFLSNYKEADASTQSF